MKVSIIIPCYNQAQYLDEAIESVLNQTYKNNEIIIINDGSPDETQEMAEFYAKKHNNIKIIKQSNKGLAAARNAGIMMATGDAILPLDADDWIEKDYLEETVRVMVDDNEIGVVTTDLRTFGQMDEVWMRPNYPVKIENLKNNNQIYVCSLIRKEAVLQCGGYNTKMIHGYEDWDLWIDIVKRGWKVGYVNRPLFHYQVKPDGMYNQVKDTWHEWNKEQIRKNHPELYEN